MVMETAKLTIDPAKAQEFEAAIAQCAPLFKAVKGCGSMRLEREVENPAHYYMLIEWESIEAHMAVGGTDVLSQWMSLVVPFYEAPAAVYHTQAVKSFF